MLLSEADVPLWPFDCTYEALFSAPKLSFVESKRTHDRWNMSLGNSVFNYAGLVKPILGHLKRTRSNVVRERNSTPIAVS